MDAAPVPNNSEKHSITARDSSTVGTLSRENTRTKISPIVFCMDDESKYGSHAAYMSDLNRHCGGHGGSQSPVTSDSKTRRASIRNNHLDEEAAMVTPPPTSHDRRSNADSESTRRVEARTSRILTATDSADLQRNRSIIEHHRSSARYASQRPQEEVQRDQDELLERVLSQKQLQLVVAQIRAADAQRYAANAQTRYYERKARNCCNLF